MGWHARPIATVFGFRSVFRHRVTVPVRLAHLIHASDQAVRQSDELIPMDID
jgi:hypothetical protein